jgi:hypothetical protein
MNMQTTIQHSINTTFTETTSGINLWNKFMNFCKGQEKNRLLWLGISLAGHGCIITPLTVIAVLLAGTNFFLFIAAIVAMGMSLVTNLAAMPTRITIPVFVLSILIDVGIVVATIVIGFDISSTYI